MQETFQMSNKELDRHVLLQQLLKKQIRQNKAAELLGISTRQVRNLVYAYKKEGTKGIISKHRGKPSNRSYDGKFKAQVMVLIREKYPDFGPTFATEKLKEYHNLSISNETLRKWMIEERLWTPRKSRRRTHPVRPPREYFGELIQIDASTHYWFEDRGEKCALIVFIDDATKTLTSLHFCKTECLEGYFQALRQHLLRYGRPRGFYSDRHSIFGGNDNIKQAQFIKALKELDIESILAGSPQAKGRVERANGVLQDRLIKEMRIRRISTIEDANHYLKEYIDDHNKRFSKEPRGQFDAHRPLAPGCDLERTLTRFEERTLTKDLCISFHSKFFKILGTNLDSLNRKKVEVRQKLDGSIKIYFKDKELSYVALKEHSSGPLVLNSKEKLVWKPKNKYIPPITHPFKHKYYMKKIREDILGTAL